MNRQTVYSGPSRHTRALAVARRSWARCGHTMHHRRLIAFGTARRARPALKWTILGTLRYSPSPRSLTGGCTSQHGMVLFWFTPTPRARTRGGAGGSGHDRNVPPRIALSHRKTDHTFSLSVMSSCDDTLSLSRCWIAATRSVSTESDPTSLPPAP